MPSGGLNYYFRIAYELLPPPLSAIPAKYRAPISLLVHSLSAGAIASEVAHKFEVYENLNLVFLMGFVHDFAQKLVREGISTIKRTKEYIKNKLEDLNFDTSDIKKTLKSIELNTAETGIVPDGVDPRVGTILKIADMMQGRLSLFELSLFIKQELSKIASDIQTMIYSIYLPQVAVRTKIMEKVIENLGDAIILVSPEGILAISNNELEPVHVDWDDLRIVDSTVLFYRSILEAEEKGNPSLANGVPSKDELKYRRWSTFARIFYRNIPSSEMMPPKLPLVIRNFLLNIVLDNVKYIETGDTVCALCGMKHSREHSFITAMYRKILGIPKGIVKNEKWNRFLPSNKEVKTKKQWSNRIGLCPLCSLDAVVLRDYKIHSQGFMIGVVSKPIPLQVFTIMSHLLDRLAEAKVDIIDVKQSTLRAVEKAKAGDIPSRLLLDYSSASIIKPVNSSKENSITLDTIMYNLPYIARLLSIGLYPLKLLPVIDTTVTDRPLVTTHMYPAFDYPVVSVKYEIMYTISQLYLAGVHDEKKILHLDYRLAPLATAYLDPKLHARVSKLLDSIRG